MTVEGNILSAESELSVGRQCRCRREPSLFVELFVVGEKCLGYQTVDGAFVDDGGTVEEHPVVADGDADDADNIQSAAEFYQP
jgi:hypothetical protein